MRTFAFFGAAAIAASILVSNGALAWTADQQPAAANGVDLSDPDNFKALQDKVNATTGFSGLQFQGSVNSGSSQYTTGNPYGVAPMTGSSSAFSYSPMPGFRGAPQ